MYLMDVHIFDKYEHLSQALLQLDLSIEFFDSLNILSRLNVLNRLWIKIEPHSFGHMVYQIHNRVRHLSSNVDYNVFAFQE